MAEGWTLSDDYTGLSPLGNFNPLPSEAYNRSAIQQRSIQDQQWAAIRAGYGSADMAYRAFAHQPLHMASPNTQAAWLNAGGMAAARGILGSGSPYTMMQGVQQALGGGGFTMEGVGGSMAGSYAARQMGVSVSRQMYSDVEGHFFQGNTPRRHRTHGLDRSDMGIVMGQLSERGAFAGMNVGSVEMMTERRLHDLSNQARQTGDTKLEQEIARLKPGDMRTTFNPQTGERIKKILEDSASALSSLRDVFGGQSMDVLMKEAERLTGMSFNTAAGAKAIKGRVEQMVTTARSFGMDPRAYAEMEFNTSVHGAMERTKLGGGTPDSYFRQTAAASPFAMQAAAQQHRSLQAAAQRAAVEGRHITVPAIEEIAAQNAAGAAAFTNFDRSVLGMSYLADNRMTDEARQTHLKLVAEMGDQTSLEAANAVKNRMRANVVEDLQRQGFSAEEAQAMLNRQEQRAATTEGSAAQRRGLRDDTNSVMGAAAVKQATRTRQGKQVDYYRRMAGIGDEYSGLVKTYQSTFSREQKDQIAKMLSSGDMEGLQAFMNDSDTQALLKDAGTSSEAFLAQLQKGGAKLGQDLEFFNTEANNSVALRNTQSLADEKAALRNYAAQKVADNFLGGNRGQMSLPDLVSQALAGNQTVDDLMVFRAAQASGQYGDQIMSTGLNATGGLDMDPEKMNQLQNVLESAGMSLGQIFGTDDETALQRLGTGEGLGHLVKSLEGKGLLVTSSVDNGKVSWNFGTDKVKKEMTDKLEADMKKTSAMDMLGMSEEEYDAFKLKTDEGFLDVMRQSGMQVGPDGKLTADQLEAKAQFEKGEMVKRLFAPGSGADGGKKIDEWINNIALDPSSTESAKAMNFMRDNASAMLPALEEQEKKLREEAKNSGNERVAKEKTEAADRLRNVRQTLANTSGPSYAGTLLVNNALLMALHTLGQPAEPSGAANAS